MEPLTDQIAEVSLTDLHVIRAALNSAYHHTLVIDLAEQYRKLAQRPAQSKLTQALQNALTLVGAHIELAEDEASMVYDQPDE